MSSLSDQPELPVIIHLGQSLSELLLSTRLLSEHVVYLVAKPLIWSEAEVDYVDSDRA